MGRGRGPDRPTARVVRVDDLRQQGYVYECVAPVGADFDPRFAPELAPAEMLALGVFGGRYLTDTRAEFPAGWFDNARLCPERHDPALNYFGVNASQPLAVCCSGPTTRAGCEARRTAQGTTIRQ